MELIQREFGIDLPIRSVGEYLRRREFTPHKPVKHAYEQQPKPFKGGLNEECPEIEKRAAQEVAEIH